MSAGFGNASLLLFRLRKRSGKYANEHNLYSAQCHSCSADLFYNMTSNLVGSNVGWKGTNCCMQGWQFAVFPTKVQNFFLSVSESEKFSSDCRSPAFFTAVKTRKDYSNYPFDTADRYFFSWDFIKTCCQVTPWLLSFLVLCQECRSAWWLKPNTHDSRRDKDFSLVKSGMFPQLLWTLPFTEVKSSGQ